LMPVVKTLSGTAAATTSFTPAAVSIPGGGTAVFTWPFTAQGAGSLSLSGAAAGVDALTGAAVSAPSATSNTAQVAAPAQLQVTSFTLPATLSRGQSFTASLVVKNAGGATANGVLPSPNPPAVAAMGGA